MNRWCLRLALAIVCCAARAIAGESKAADPRVRELLAAGPLRFEKNLGQTDAQALFLARHANYTLFLTRDGAVLSLPGTLSSFGEWPATDTGGRWRGASCGSASWALARTRWSRPEKPSGGRVTTSSAADPLPGTPTSRASPASSTRRSTRAWASPSTEPATASWSTTSCWSRGPTSRPSAWAWRAHAGCGSTRKAASRSRRITACWSRRRLSCSRTWATRATCFPAGMSSGARRKSASRWRVTTRASAWSWTLS